MPGAGFPSRRGLYVIIGICAMFVDVHSGWTQLLDGGVVHTPLSFFPFFSSKKEKGGNFF